MSRFFSLVDRYIALMSRYLKRSKDNGIYAHKKPNFFLEDMFDFIFFFPIDYNFARNQKLMKQVTLLYNDDWKMAVVFVIRKEK